MTKPFSKEMKDAKLRRVFEFLGKVHDDLLDLYEPSLESQQALIHVIAAGQWIDLAEKVSQPPTLEGVPHDGSPSTLLPS